MSGGNFEFIKEYNPKVYKKLNSAEKKARINFRDSGKDIRDALEGFVKTVIERYDLSRTFPKNSDLNDKIKGLRDEEFLRKAGYLKKGERLEDKPILPNLGQVTYKLVKGVEEKGDYYDFIRRFGNACAHPEVKPENVKISYANVIQSLKGFHTLFRNYYKARLSNNMPQFDENLMPIGEYHVYHSYEPMDKLRSKCDREFLAYTLDSEGEKEFYAVIRLYNKSDLQTYFLQRNHKCFAEASKLSISSVPEGMTKMRVLTPIDSQETTFYVVSYVFNREPFELSDSILAGMTLKQRIKLCCRIANCMYNLHNLEVHIEHRMLNYESIFVCKFKDEWIPYVIKFDFAKIESQTVKQTVLLNAVDAKERIKENKIAKYLPPEWLNMQSPEKLNWAKVDIYSLGILFSDILYGKISEFPVSTERLEEFDLSEEILDLLDCMRADAPDDRYDISFVKEMLDDELRN